MSSVRRLLLLAAIFAATPFTSPGAVAQDYPNRAIRLVVPFAPGGGTDNLVRILLPSLSATLGQSVVVENRPGAATVIGTDLVAKSPADGYTLLASDSAYVINPALLKGRMPYDPLKDLTGVTMMATAPVILVTHPSVPAANLKELLALARAKPGSLSYASGGNGASTHLAGELMKLATDTRILHIPYKGTGPAMNDLLGGQVNMQFAGISSAKQHVESGRLRAIAMTGEKRNPAMPDVPTFIEAGVKGVDASSYWGIYAPAATPPDVIRKLNEAFVKALRSAEIVERIAGLGYLPVANTPGEHNAQVRTMVDLWTDVVQRANIKPD